MSSRLRRFCVRFGAAACVAGAQAFDARHNDAAFAHDPSQACKRRRGAFAPQARRPSHRLRAWPARPCRPCRTAGGNAAARCRVAQRQRQVKDRQLLRSNKPRAGAAPHERTPRRWAAERRRRAAAARLHERRVPPGRRFGRAAWHDRAARQGEPPCRRKRGGGRAPPRRVDGDDARVMRRRCDSRGRHADAVPHSSRQYVSG
ncbi:hypothetical protein AQ611_12470 [Burkholderia singularis]|nr:hypothetical protein AQ611_12470 [Burkholderia sp. Bp7605]